MAAGDVVNTAARLQSAAPVNGILVGETTYRATRETIEYREAASRSRRRARRSPFPVWEVVAGARALRRRPRAARRARRSSAASASSSCSSTRSRASRRERSPQLVTLVGVPGIGKSRLVGELFQSIDARRRADVLAAGTLAAVRRGRQLLGARRDGEGAGRHPRDATPTTRSRRSCARRRAARRRATTRLGRSPPAPARRAGGRAEPAATAATRRSPPGAASSRRSPSSARSCSSSRTCTGPTTACSTSSTTSSTGSTGVPLLVLCTARPELLERRPGWGGGKPNAATLALAPLSDDETARLIAALLDRPLLDGGRRRRRCSTAPAATRSTPSSSCACSLERGTGDDLPLPETVQGIIAARLDALPAEEKRLLQDAAVVGKVFWLGGALRSAARGDAHRRDASRARAQGVRAARAALVGRRRDGVRVPARRSSATSRTARSRARERAEKHVRAAEWIESLGRPRTTPRCSRTTT